jgi:hypothetical protein
MARTILEIAVEAAERRNTAPAPTTLFGTNSKIAKLLRTAAKDTIRDYLTRTGHKGLSEFHSTWVFSLQPGRFAYPLPPDFLRIIPNTEYRGGWPLGLVGPASPEAWASWIFGGGVTAVEMGWRVRNGAIMFNPTPTAAELIAVEYISNYPVVSRIRDGDIDTAISPPQVNAPFVPRDGYISLEGLDVTPAIDGRGRYDSIPGWDVAKYGAEASEVLRRLNIMSTRAPFPEVRRPEFADDADKPAFADDHVLSLGMTFRLRRGLGLDFIEEAAEYENEMAQRMDHDAGGARSIALGQGHADYGTYPLGAGNWLVT